MHANSYPPAQRSGERALAAESPTSSCGMDFEPERGTFSCSRTACLGAAVRADPLPARSARGSSPPPGREIQWRPSALCREYDTAPWAVQFFLHDDTEPAGATGGHAEPKIERMRRALPGARPARSRRAATPRAFFADLAAHVQYARAPRACSTHGAVWQTGMACPRSGACAARSHRRFSPDHDFLRGIPGLIEACGRPAMASMAGLARRASGHLARWRDRLLLPGCCRPSSTWLPDFARTTAEMLAPVPLPSQGSARLRERSTW